MTQDNIYHNLMDKILAKGIILILLVVPLLMFQYDFINIKYSFLQMGTLLLASFYIIFRKEKFWAIIRENPLTWFITAFFITALLSISGAQNYILAFDQLRIFICFILLFYLASLIHSELREIAIIIVISSAVVAVLGFLQYIWGEKFIYSTLGNPNYIAEFFGMTLIIAFSLFLTESRHLVKIIIGIAIYIIYSLMLVTYGRGAWLGFNCGLIVYLFLLYSQLTSERKRLVKYLSGLLSGLIIITIIFFSLSNFFSTPNTTFKQDSPSNTLLSNLYKNVSINRSIETRLAIWQDTWKMIKDNFLTGVGIGNYELTYSTYRNSLSERAEIRVNRAHNDYLQVWAEQGILGLIALIAFFIVLFWLSIISLKNIKDKNHKIWLIGLICSIITILVNNFLAFGFYNPVPAMLLWILAGIISGKLICTQSFQPEFFLIHAVNYYYDNNYIQSIKEGEKAFRVNSNDLRILELQINSYQELRQWKSSIVCLNYGLSLYPNYALFHTLLGDAFLNSGDYGSAIASYRESTRIFPLYARPHLALGIIYFRLKRFDSAISELKKVKLPESDLADAYNILSIIYARKKNYDLAIKYATMAISLDSANMVFRVNLKGILARSPQSKR